MNVKKIGKVFTSKSVGTGPSSCEKRIYRAAVSQRLGNSALWSGLPVQYRDGDSFFFNKRLMFCWLQYLCMSERISSESRERMSSGWAIVFLIMESHIL